MALPISAEYRLARNTYTVGIIWRNE